MSHHCQGQMVPSSHYFYRENYLVTQVRNEIYHTIVGDPELLCAQMTIKGFGREALLLVVDTQLSVIKGQTRKQRVVLAYTPYGFNPLVYDSRIVPGFNGQPRDSTTGHYTLGAGVRQYNPMLMRFNSADSWSPFGNGGLNAYAYCAGDPINRIDPTGHMPHRPKSGPGLKQSKRRASYARDSQGPSPESSKKSSSKAKAASNAPTKWTLREDKIRSTKELHKSEQEKYENFKSLIGDNGYHPKTAAELVGDMKYTRLDKGTGLHEVRVSGGNRVSFYIYPSEKIVEIREVGGHT
ncbi:RHS repeat-associated core domain-containing protein [Pseudomonas capeferrum]|uniref:RHS repeat-associated core domain-containing protein n=1 Tax=Pseudomonas capeferrum TaxID=1495066 RepID=UPI0015E2D897|nr:RHS repeat-associated core domain-containing protein [Pseudomonas capeferrum]MBA1201524.1 RHS repeat-associated core domain-containing protein [Pseudomonas capeferrum]